MASESNLDKQFEQAIAYDNAAHKRETYRVANEECWLKGKKMDKWDRKTNFNCDSCMFYVPKPNYGTNLGACRKNASTMTGYPVVNAELDWCGEHKIGSNPVRDAGKKYSHKFSHYEPGKLGEEGALIFDAVEKAEIKYIKDAENDGQMHYECEKCGEKSPNAIGLVCRLCRGAIRDISPLTKEDVRKVLDEPLPSPVFDQPLVSTDKTLQEKAATAYYFCVMCDSAWGKVTNEPGEYKTCPKCEEKAKVMLEEESDDNRKKETITAVYPVDLEEKAIIKRRIREQCEFLLIAAGIADSTERNNDTKLYATEIKKLLEKL